MSVLRDQHWTSLKPVAIRTTTSASSRARFPRGVPLSDCEAERSHESPEARLSARRSGAQIGGTQGIRPALKRRRSRPSCRRCPVSVTPASDHEPVLPRAAFEAVPLADRVRVSRRRLAEQSAEIVEVRLRRRPLLQLRRPPLGDEFARRHDDIRSDTRRRRQRFKRSHGAARFIGARFPVPVLFESPCNGLLQVASPVADDDQ